MLTLPWICARSNDEAAGQHQSAKPHLIRLPSEFSILAPHTTTAFLHTESPPDTWRWVLGAILRKPGVWPDGSSLLDFLWDLFSLWSRGNWASPPSTWPFLYFHYMRKPWLVFWQLRIWQAGNLGKATWLTDAEVLQTTKHSSQFTKFLVGGGGSMIHHRHLKVFWKYDQLCQDRGWNSMHLSHLSNRNLTLKVLKCIHNDWEL